MLVAASYKNLSDFVLPMITQELWERVGMGDGWDRFVKQFNKQNLIAYLTNGSTIYFRSADNPDSLRGPNLGFFGIDEAAKNPWLVWKLMVARLRIAPEKGIITTTPRGRNWVWEEFARKPRKNYTYFVGATDENRHLSKDYIESLKESYNGSFLQQEFYGQFIAHKGLVYQLEPQKHHLSAPEPGDDTVKYAVAGVDFGWVDPNVILVGLVRFDGMIHVVDEFYANKTPIGKVVKRGRELSEKWGGLRNLWCDSSRPDFIRDLRNGGLNARKGRKDLDPGIGAVNAALNKGLLKFDFDRCPQTIEEAEQYRYDEDDLGRIVKSKPVDESNHCMDALRYMVYSHSRQGVSVSTKGYR